MGSASRNHAPQVSCAGTSGISAPGMADTQIRLWETQFGKIHLKKGGNPAGSLSFFCHFTGIINDGEKTAQ
jgi:hypothetical protein